MFSRHQGMGAGANIYALMVGLAAFAGWTLCLFNLPRRVGSLNMLGGAGILALFFSIVSPDDDGFQQELIRPATSSARLSAHSRVAPRRPPSNSSIKYFVETRDPIRLPRNSARLSWISLLSLRPTFTFSSPSTPRQLFHDLLSISNAYVLKTTPVLFAAGAMKFSFYIRMWTPCIGVGEQEESSVQV
jgi:hypothetical protein